MDLGLAVMRALAEPGVCHTLEEIAAFCDCSDAAIRRIERKALRKVRRKLREQGICHWPG